MNRVVQGVRGASGWCDAQGAIASCRAACVRASAAPSVDGVVVRACRRGRREGSS